MKANFKSKLLRRLWLAGLILFIAVWLFPVSTTATRSTGLVLFAVIWIGLIALAWPHRLLRYSLLGFSTLCAIFLVSPPRRNLDAASLSSAYVTGLRHYDGVSYYWGGESPKGIDCSGLIRRGMIDSFFLRGISTFDAGLVRHAFWLWWHDTTARDLGEGHGYTIHLADTPSINALDHSKILPGDLAVTSDGLHIMAYLGDNLWIEADPGIGRVVTISVPTDNAWFRVPMNIVRWNVLQ